ncbi:MAG: hypothetical protein AAGF24_04395 [Cyanobacteria bacterium P01_H01_bin.121]
MPVKLTNDLGIQPPEQKRSVLEALAHQQELIGNKEGAEFLRKTREELLSKAQQAAQPVTPQATIPTPAASHQAEPPITTVATATPAIQAIPAGSLQTDFVFELPKGYVSPDGTLHRQGVMRLARAIDEVMPMKDPRVQANPAYATIIILARVITQLGSLPDINPIVIENLFACDLNFLQNFYRQINDLA